jgi:hypothetical protein
MDAALSCTNLTTDRRGSLMNTTVASGPPVPAPTPRSRRPPASWSRVMISFANGTGWRKFGVATRAPGRILGVPAAAAASSMLANQGSSREWRHDRWS